MAAAGPCPAAAPMLMGFPLVEAEDMPNIGTDATPIAFGDFGRGYLVVDRAGVRVIARSLFGQALRAVLHHPSAWAAAAPFTRISTRSSSC